MKEAILSGYILKIQNISFLLNSQGRIQDLSEEGGARLFYVQKIFELGTKKRAAEKFFFDLKD